MDKTTKLTDQFGSKKMSSMEGIMNIYYRRHQFLHKLLCLHVYTLYVRHLTFEHQLRKGNC